MTTRAETLKKISQKRKKTKPMKGDASVAPDNPLAREQGIDEEHRIDAMSQGSEDTDSSLSWRQGAPLSQAAVERSETSTRSTPAPIHSGMEGTRPFIERTMMGSVPSRDDGLSTPTMTPMGAMGIYPSSYFTDIEETPTAEMSNETRRARRAEKRIDRAPIGGDDSMIYLLVERLQRLGLSAGFTQDEWRMGVRYLRVPAVHRGEGSLLERLERTEPPKSYDNADWQAFIHAIAPEVRLLEGGGYQSPLPRRVTSQIVKLPIRQSATATPDTLQMVEKSLTMPRQPDKTSSTAGRRMGAAQWARNPPQTKEETLSTSGRSTAPLDDEAVRIERVAFQRVCNSQIRERGEATVPDQGIVFDRHNRPWDTRLGQPLRKEDPVPTSGRSRDERVNPPMERQRPRGNAEGLPGEPPGGGGGGDDDGGPSFTGDEEDYRSQAPSDEEEIVEMPAPGGGVVPERKGLRNMPQVRSYFTPYQRSHTAELDVYKDRGNPRPSKYRKAIHQKYYLLIDKHLDQEAETSGGVKAPKVPEPQRYSGASDAETFERWLTTLLRWFWVNKYVGRAFNSEHVVFTAMYLEGTALMWYDDNIDGIDCQEKVWSFKYLVTGLYDRFIHSEAVSEAVDKFWTATYEPEEGVMPFYYRMARYAARMVWPPDHYTFKTQFVMRLPQGIFEYMLDREVTAEYSTMENILHHTR
jgi:hypothetical protein